MSDIDSFVESFYAASDVGPSGHQAYADHFHQDATLVMGPTTFDGHAGILQFRETAWEKVKTRRHVVLGKFPADESKGEQQVMLYGTVDYVFKDGMEKKGTEWAARMVLTKAEGESSLRLQFYQVYLVSQPQAWMISNVDPDRCH